MTSARLDPALALSVINEAERRREEIVDLCARLVAARSVNPDGDTRAMASLVAETLTGFGITPGLEQCVDSMPSVVANIESGRPGPHLVLNVHLDTMPPGDEAAWTEPVWKMTRKDGRLYGLGMGNMKGAVAAMLVAVDLLKRHRGHWDGRVTFTAVSDEVVFGDNGAAFLLREHPELRGDGLICGEGPGYARLAIGEKGVLWLDIQATGDAGHSSSVRPGRSASARLARAVSLIDGLNGARGTLPPELHTVSDDGSDTGLELTANVGTVSAGTFIGQIATTGHAGVDLRLPPGITAAEAENLVRDRLVEAPGLTVQRIKGWDSNWTSPESPLIRAWHDAAKAAGLPEPRHAIRLPASDASRWRQLGAPALCYGPQPTLSAGIDDYAVEDEVIDCVSLYTLAAIAFLTSERA